MNQSLFDLALEYLQDLKSSGVEGEQRMKGAVEDYLALDEDELEEVWGRWERMKLEPAQSAEGS